MKSFKAFKMVDPVGAAPTRILLSRAIYGDINPIRTAGARVQKLIHQFSKQNLLGYVPCSISPDVPLDRDCPEKTPQQFHHQ